MYKRQSQGGTNNGLLCAAIVLVVVPVLVVYIVLQKNIIKGLTAGAVKGLSLIHIYEGAWGRWRRKNAPV